MKVLRFVEDIRIHQRINPKISRCTTAFNEVEKRFTYESIKGMYIKKICWILALVWRGRPWIIYHSKCIIVGYSKTPNWIAVVVIRGGVEDTKLEAKATKKIRGQGQGQRFRGQTLSRPRTGMLEAKDQGHSRKCSPKKKGLQKSFSGNLQFIGVARIFDWGCPNHKSHAMTSSKICLLALNQDFAKGEGLN